jgi:DNA-binding NarL/FixJ family response regulator
MTDTGSGREAIRLLVAEDNEDLRAAIVALIDGEDDMECVADAGSVDVVALLTREHAPDVVILDIELQGESSLKSLERLRANCPAARFIVFSGHALPELERGAIAAGAAAYVRKSADMDQLFATIRRVARP